MRLSNQGNYSHRFGPLVALHWEHWFLHDVICPQRPTDLFQEILWLRITLDEGFSALNDLDLVLAVNPS